MFFVLQVIDIALASMFPTRQVALGESDKIEVQSNLDDPTSSNPATYVFFLH